MQKHLFLRKIIAGVAALLLTCTALMSCGGGEGSETTGDETTGGSEEVEMMDFSTLDLTPYISLGQYKGVPISVRETEYLISLREAMLEDDAYFSIVTDGTYEPKGSDDFEIIVDETRTVKEGDVINVDYKGFLNGVAFDGGAASSQDISVFENGVYISGFANGFIGTAVGQKSAFNVTFPENYSTESLAGKEVTFEFTVNYIYEFDALSEEIVTDISGGEYTDPEAYENFLRTTIVQKYLWEKVIKNATLIEYPKQQVQYYYNQNRSFYEYYANYHKLEYEVLLSYMGLTDADLYESAKEYVLADLVHYAILRAENLTLTDEEFNAKVDTYIERYMDEFGYTEKEVREKLMDNIRETMLYDKLQETLVSWADVTWEQ